MTTRCIIRNLLLSSAALALVMVPSFSRAATIANPDVLTWTSAQPGLFIPSTQYPTLTAWNAGAALAGVSPGAFAPSGLTYTGGLNLVNNDLIIQADNPTDALAAYTNLYNEAKAGYNGGQWNTSPGANIGLFTDSTNFGTIASGATDPQLLTGIGVVLNDLNGNDVFGNDTGYSTFDGVSVGVNSVLAKFTYYGDTALRGIVDESDFFNAVGGRDAAVTGWANGETEYNGVVTQQNVFDVEGSRDGYLDDPIVNPSDPAVALPGAMANVGPVTVPEPASIVMELFAAIGLAGGCAVQRRRVSKA